MLLCQSVNILLHAKRGLLQVQWLVFLALVGQFSKALMRFLNVGALFLIAITYAALVLINFLACIWFFTATLEGLDNSWLTSVGA